MKTIADYQRAKPNYLNSQFPCEVSGWHKFSTDAQTEMKTRQRQHLWELGYAEQPDGSFVKAPPVQAKLNKKKRRAQQLLAHYSTCERLSRYLGHPNPDGKKISVALWKAERLAHDGATAYCNGEEFHHEGKSYPWHKEWAWEDFSRLVAWKVKKALGTLPPGFFVNGDPRGYSCKIDNETEAGRALIDACQLHRDMGGFGILSPEIDGN